MEANSAILTVSHRMPFWKVEAFLKSLRRTDYSGRVIFFASLLDSRSRQEMLELGVEISPFLFLSRGVRQRLSEPWWFWRRWFAVSQPAWLRELVSRRVLHLFYLRHLLYLKFLEKNPKITRVLMCDCRDVYFQNDPFSDWPGEGIHAFQEDGHLSLGTCEHHRRWITQLSGQKTLERLFDRPRVCAGTIMADRDSAIIFLRKMLEMTYAAPSMKPFDGDQGLFNIIIHDQLIPKIHIHQNGASSVLTVDSRGEYNLTTDDEGFVVRSNGSRIPILHQYDRRKEIAGKLLEKIGLQSLVSDSKRKRFC